MTTEKEYEYLPVAGSEDTAASAEQDVKINFQSKITISESEKPTNRKFLYIAASVANLSSFVAGQALGWTSPEIPKLKLTHDMGNPLQIPLTKSEESWIGSLLPVGAIFGPFIANVTADRIGRKNTLLLGTIPFVIAFLLAAFATTPIMFFVVRFLFGLGVGIVFMVVPMYIGEIAEDSVRDLLGSFLQLFVVFGFLFSYALGPYTSITVFNILSVSVPCLFAVIFYIFIPKSPYFLIRTDRAAAEEALMKLRSRSPEAIQAEMEKIQSSVAQSLKAETKFMDIFKSRGLTKALILSIGVLSFQQLSGINVVLFYAQDIFTEAGSTIPPEISAIIIAIVQILSSGAAPFIVNKKGKKFLLILSAIGMVISLGALSFFFYIKTSGIDVSAFAGFPVLCLVAYIVTYCIGFGPLPWPVMAEMFPSDIKAVASTVSTSGCWILSFILTKYFALINDLIGPAGSFGIFAVCCVLAALFVYKFLPNTTGKSLQEIQDILSGTSSCINTS